MSVAISAKVTDAVGAVSTAFASAANTSPSTITLGTTTILSGNDSGDGGLLAAYQVTLAQSATAQSLSFYVITAAGKLRLGIYDATGPSAGPGKLLAQIPEITPVAGWNTTNVTTPVLLPAANYWLAYLPSDGNLHFPIGSGTATFIGIGYGAMPATFPTTNLSHGGYAFSLYATLSTTAQASFTIALSTPLASDGSVAGTLIGTGTFTAGSTQTVSATMNAGFAFASWSDATGILSTSSTYTFALVKNMSLTMNWVVTKSPIIPPGGPAIIPADRLTVYQPGVTYNKIPAVGAAGNIAPSDYTQSGYGIPNRTTIFTTLSPLGPLSSNLDDGPQINSAWINCPPGQVVQLTAGVFNIKTNLRYLPVAGRGFTGGGDVTLRGVGPGAALNFGTSPVLGPGTFTADPTATQLYYGNTTNGFGPAVAMNGADTSQTFNSITNLAADAIKGSYTCTLVSSPSLVPGQLVKIDQYCSLAAVATIAATSSFTTATTTIPMASSNPGTIFPGMWVNDLTGNGNSQGGVVGYVQSYTGSTLVLTSPSRITSTGTTDSLQFSLYPFQSNDPDIWWGPNNGDPGTQTRFFFNRGDRVLQEVKEVATVDGTGTIITFTTPFHHTMCAGSGISASGVHGGLAQLCTFGTNANVWAMGLEELQVAFGLAGGNGNIIMGGCAYSWIKHVESYWNDGASVLVANAFRCEVRDSFIHESKDPNPGGGGYLMDMQNATADSLVENCIFWNGNKQIVGQATGGGNVIGYCYGDDAFGAGYPEFTEAGLNMAHMCGSHMELVEGCYSHRFDGDTYWGNVVDQTVFRCWLSALRGAHPPLDTYVDGSGHPYVDGNIRAGVSIGGFANRTNVAGCVLGYNGQTLIVNVPGLVNQTFFQYEELDALTGGQVMMWYIGSYQGPANLLTMVPNTYQTQLRQGNWDWVSASQKWHGIGGSDEYGGNPSPPYPAMPNSLYLKSKPAFFGSNPWPWVNPSNGTTGPRVSASSTLPAMARFWNGTPNTL